MFFPLRTKGGEVLKDSSQHVPVLFIKWFEGKVPEKHLMIS